MENMTSKESGASEHALMNLIYRHLKENGYKKAASALKQHVSQVPTTNVNLSLEGIFKKWLSNEREKTTDEGKPPQTSSESITNAAHNTKPEEKTLTTARQQKRKSSKTKMCENSSVVMDLKAGEDSDSDSSLDVEKWKRLALEISDADFAKMDAFTNFSTSTAKSTKTRKPAKPRKQRMPKKTKAKTATSPSKTDKKKPTNKKTLSSVESDEITTPFNTAILADSESPKRKTASILLDQIATPVSAVSNGLSESDGTNFQHTEKHSLSKCHSMKTSKENAEIEKTELKPTDTPCKKTKSRKNLTAPGGLETPGEVTDDRIDVQTFQCGLDSVLYSKTGTTKAKKDKSKKGKNLEPVGLDTFIQTEEITDALSSEQSKINQVLDFMPTETKSKKAKSKKSKKSKEPEDVPLPPEECEIQVDYNHSNQHQTNALSESVKKVSEPEAVKKHSKKVRKSLAETNESERPTKNSETQIATSILEPISSETPSKKSKSKSKKHSHAAQVDSPSKQAVVDAGDGDAAKNNSSPSDQTFNSFKKTKRKRADSCGDHVTLPVTEHVSEGQYNSVLSVGISTKHQDQECVIAVNEEENPQPKKRKKHKKDKEKKINESDENVEEIQPPPPEQECADLLLNSEKKKKKKKQKHREEEVPHVSTPVPEEYSMKKKKKSSKKKEHTDVSE